jgi:hypothetical protein
VAIPDIVGSQDLQDIQAFRDLRGIVGIPVSLDSVVTQDIPDQV